jgi:Domain of unknown function (DUF4202)
VNNERERFDAAIALVDAANSGDANTLTVAGVPHPKEAAHSEMLTLWVRKLAPEPSDELLLAARAHHIRRWERPRNDYAEGRGGYLRWRIDAEQFHADVAADLMRQAGYHDEAIERVRSLIAKKGLATKQDAELQALEDGLCLVFLETQLNEIAGRIDREKMISILRKTWKKMSADGQRHALELTFNLGERDLIAEALA